MVTRYTPKPVKNALKILQEVLDSNEPLESKARAAAAILEHERTRARKTIASVKHRRVRDTLRDDLKAARARITELEMEVAELRRKLEEARAPKASSGIDGKTALRNVLHGLINADAQSAPAPVPAVVVPTAPKPRFDDGERAAIRSFAEGGMSVSKLESALQPFVRITWVGTDNSDIASVTLDADLTVVPSDRATISAATVQQVTTMAGSNSPRDRQFAREFSQFVAKCPQLFNFDADVLKELGWLRQLVLRQVD